MQFDNRVSKKYVDKLSEHVNKIYDKNSFIPLELLTDMVFVSDKTGFECAAVISKKGVITDVYIGDKNSVSITVERFNKRQNGLRVIHTHPSGSSKLSAMDKSLLLNNNLDCICAISIKDGNAYDAEVGFINGDHVDTVHVANAQYINKMGLMEKIREYNDLFLKNVDQNSTGSEILRAVLVLVSFNKKTNIEYGLQELENLAGTQGIVSVASVFQNRDKPDVTHLVGEGKVAEIKQLIQLHDANLVIFNNELSGSRLNNLETAFQTKVIDRNMLILDIFSTRANSREAILQIELAQLKYRLPRLYGIANSQGRFGGGVGQRGPGETKLEISRRVIEKDIFKKEQELSKISQGRELTRRSRQRENVKSVAIVGYTNSGKSTLLNTITKASVYAKDELFATLNTTTRSLWLDSGKQIVLTDTVGFISDLPHEFIKAFNSTLEETVRADLLIHVVDASNPDYELQQQVVEDLLESLGADSNIITAYNKIDKLTDTSKLPQGDNCVLISASKNIGIAELREKIKSNLF